LPAGFGWFGPATAGWSRPKRLVNGFGVVYHCKKRREACVIKRLTILASLLALGLSLGGCSKCGFWWDDWRSSPDTCKSDLPKPR
jgi:hypothetical protein